MNDKRPMTAYAAVNPAQYFDTTENIIRGISELPFDQNTLNSLNDNELSVLCKKRRLIGRGLIAYFGFFVIAVVAHIGYLLF